MAPAVDLRSVVGGVRVDAPGCATLPVLSPWSGEPLGELAAGDEPFVASAIDAAAAALPAWRATTPRERSEVLHRLADLLAVEAERFAHLESLDGGKPLADAEFEVAEGVDVLRFFAGAARTLHATGTAQYVHAAVSSVVREPIGVVGLITPWNYPLLEALWKIAPALAAGNAIVVKPSEMTSVTTVAFAELAARVLPPGVLNAVTGPGAPTGHALVSDPRIRAVSFTGSVATGRAVAALGGETLTRLHLELGGNAPVIVMGDVDAASTVERLLPAAFSNAGQSCTAACRLLVERTRYDDVVDELTRQAGKLRLATRADDPEGGIGPLVSARHRERVLGFLDHARRDGARVVGGEPVGGGDGAAEAGGFFLTPAVVTEVEQRSEIVQEEVFGPVVTVQPVASLDEALAWANDVRFGLAASIWTASLDCAARATAELEFGTVWVNDHSVNPVETPFSGFGESGYGSELSSDSILEYSRVKHVMSRAAPRPDAG